MVECASSRVISTFRMSSVMSRYILRVQTPAVIQRGDPRFHVTRKNARYEARNVNRCVLGWVSTNFSLA